MKDLLSRAKSVWPGLTAQDLKLVLAVCTQYPLGKDDDVLAALSDAYNKSDGNLLTALEQAEERLIKQQITR